MVVQVLTKEDAQYIIIGMQDGWLKFNQKEYTLAKKILKYDDRKYSYPFYKVFKKSI